MKSSLAITLAIAAVLNAGSAQAAVHERDWKTPGDGLLTYDDVNQREWLNLSVSRLSQFPEPKLDHAILEIAPGGLFDGFKWANRHDVVELAESAGIDTSTWNFSVNETFASQLISLLGVSFHSSTSSHSIGFLNEMDGTLRAGADFFVQFNIFTGEGTSAGLSTSSSNDWLRVPSTGLMLYRSLPEPATGILAIVAMSGILGIFRGQKRRTEKVSDEKGETKKVSGMLCRKPRSAS